MRSLRGFLGSIVFLLALPTTILTQVLFGSGSGTVVHLALAAGSVLVASAVFDFDTPRWIAWVGCASMAGLAAIFFLQAVSLPLGNDALSSLSYQVLGNWPERVLPDLFILWLAALLPMASRGRTRVLGFVAVIVVVCLEIYSYGLLLFGTSASTLASGLKVLYLIPFAWLLFESRKRPPKKGSSHRGRART